jgi:hypothetical protein
MEDKDERKKRIFKAFDISKQNSYLRMLSGDEQLFYLFMEGMKFAKTDTVPESLLNNEDFLKDPEKYEFTDK